MAVEVAPAPQLPIKGCDHEMGGLVPQLPAAFLEFSPKRLNLDLCRFREKFSVVFPQVETKKVKAILDVGDVGLFLGEGESTFSQERGNGRLNGVLQEGGIFSCTDEVVRVTDEVHLRPSWCNTGDGLLESVENHVGQKGRDHPALRRTLIRREESAFFHKTGFEPLVENAFIHGDMRFEPRMVNRVEAGFDISFEDPGCAVSPREDDMTLLDGIGHTAVGSETIGMDIGLDLGDGDKRHGVEGLHGPIAHGRNPQRAHLSVGFSNEDAPQRTTLVAPAAQCLCGLEFGLRRSPNHTINTWRTFPFTGCHGPNGQEPCGM